jgi:hypothetical protein
VSLPVAGFRCWAVAGATLHCLSARVSKHNICQHDKNKYYCVFFSRGQKFEYWIFTFTWRTKDLLKLNRDQLRWVVGLLIGHCHLKGHLFKLGWTDDPICERCLEEDESATHTSYVIVRL